MDQTESPAKSTVIDLAALPGKVEVKARLNPAKIMSLPDFLDWFEVWWEREVEARARVREVYKSWEKKPDKTIDQFIERLEEIRRGGLNQAQWEILHARIVSVKKWYDEQLSPTAKK